MCGFCYTLESCNSTTGYCMTGCESGYKTEPVCTEASPAGYFGSECKQLCSGYCVGGQENCDNVHGTCLDGCTVGWKGRTCKEVCDNGTYSQNCSFKCSGHCKHNAGCNKQDGTCQDGCSPGYTGGKCDLCEFCSSSLYSRTSTGMTYKCVPLFFLQLITYQLLLLDSFCLNLNTSWGQMNERT
ncbi:protein draper-like [Mercenaria mercenaria]|uniref:protein draper-like n=1 Tax=Mercenaria mercenaria TaxID=6596 RepID=UPI00234EB8A9|nr:protein draper-like [Mercenaria mercenaria]